MNHAGGMMVSICCITYNHEPYIRECLDGFLMQKTDFKFEILIHDDASTDKTADIIREYQMQYPDIIKPIYQTENQYSKGVRPINKFNFERAKGKYIAMCEGDDYWIDPLKLQKQVDFLESNKNYSMCFSNCKLISNKNISHHNIGLSVIEEDKDYNANEILDNWTIPTASVLFRNVLDKRYFEILSNNKKFIYGDIILFLFMAEKGLLFGMSDYFVVYRRHEGGVTSATPSLSNFQRQYYHFIEILRQFGGRFYSKKIKRYLAIHSFSIAYFNAKKFNIVHALKFLFLSIYHDNTYLISIIRDQLIKSR